MADLLLAQRDPDLRERGVLVVGLGKSGLAAARLAVSRGARVTVTDNRRSAELGNLPARARALGIALVLGSNPVELAESAELVVISPGVPQEIELVQAARRRGVPVWGEIELAARFRRGRLIGITGSNGKSTVTAMIGGILRGAGIPGGTGGNLDTPLAELLDSDEPAAVHAVELSSFQLETVECLQPEVAVVLNLSPDHLDRYDSYEDYARAKARLLDVQKADSDAILNADDPESRRFHDHLRGRLHQFSTRGPVESGAFLTGDSLTLRVDGRETDLLDTNALPLPGEHNVANALAAALAAHLAGCSAGAIVEGLRSFRALPHRLEHVATIGGVSFYNDSKATNPASAAQALSSFAPGTVHLILGGKDKGADWDELAGLLPRFAKRVLLVGRSTDALAERLVGSVPLEICGSVGRAVQSGFREAAAGEVVLLSPACASFDQYRNFEERGEDFRRTVEAIRSTGDEDA